MKIKFNDSHDKCMDAITRYCIATSAAFLIKVNLSFFWNIQQVTQHTTKAELIKAAASLRVLICCKCYGTFVWLIEGSSATLILTYTINEDSSSLWKHDRFNSPATQYCCFFYKQGFNNKIEKQRDKGVSGRMSTLFFQKQCGVLYFFILQWKSLHISQEGHTCWLWRTALMLFLPANYGSHLSHFKAYKLFALCKIL